jgi:membrane-associated HD superfamily phosphohydrolase
MLQLMKMATAVFNIKEIIKLHNLYPQVKHTNAFHCSCSQCCYVNFDSNNFCTNCGFPIKEEGTSTLYHVRIKQRKELLKKTEKDVQTARAVLYILSIFFLSGISFLFGSLDNRYLLSLVSITFSGLFFLLARWSYSYPFISIITGFIIILTLSAVSIFGQFVKAFTTVIGVYGIFISMILIYFLLRGVQGAYKADLIKEEMEIV